MIINGELLVKWYAENAICPYNKEKSLGKTVLNFSHVFAIISNSDEGHYLFSWVEFAVKFPNYLQINRLILQLQ